MSGQVRSFPASEIQFPRPRLRLVLGKLNYLGLETHRSRSTSPPDLLGYMYIFKVAPENKNKELFCRLCDLSTAIVSVWKFLNRHESLCAGPLKTGKQK